MNLKFHGIQPLFYSPLAIFHLDAAPLNEQLLAEIAQRQAKSSGINRSNWGGWHSECDLFERLEPGCQQLRQHIFHAIQICTQNVAPDFNFSHYKVQAEGWFNVLDPGGLNTPHDHPGWIWSGCYYIQVPEGGRERSGYIEFLDSRTNVRALTVEGAACFASKQLIQPQAGMLLIFPSYLRHWVYPNETSEKRVMAAFNIRFAKIIEG